jgi:hypothetical protein
MGSSRSWSSTTCCLAVVVAVPTIGGCSDSESPVAPSVDAGADAAEVEDAGPADAAPDADLPDALDGSLPDAPEPSDELLLYDGDGEQFTEGDNGFHALVEPGDSIPAPNWSAPIDYYDGEIQIRYVINGPANQEPGMLQTCIWTMGEEDGDGRNYFPESCAAQVAHTGVGEYFDPGSVVSQWWKNDGTPLDFSHPERFLIRAVLRGESGCNVTTYGVSNACWNEWPKYQDMTFRVTMVMVPPGETFSGWDNY